MTSLSTSSKGRDRPKSVFASADATLTLSKGASVVSNLLSVDGQAAKFGAVGFFFSGQGCCVLCQQSVVQTSRYMRVLGARLDHWRPSCVSLVEKRMGGIGRQQVNGMVEL